jgi:hypothetical protein
MHFALVTIEVVATSHTFVKHLRMCLALSSFIGQ